MLCSIFSDNEGTIDLTRHLSLGGSFKGIEPMGLFWSLQSFTKKNELRRFIKRDATPLVYEITLLRGWYSSLSDIRYNFDARKVNSCRVTRTFMAPGMKRIEVNENGLKGTLFLPAGKGPFPGVINMYGGIPGSPEFKPALLASHGFAAFGLAYYGREGLPEDWFNLEMEYFEKAVQFLRNHVSVKGEKGIGIIGSCKGGQIALAMADCLSGIKCVIVSNCAVNATHNNHSYEKRVWKGTDVAKIPYIRNEKGAYSSRVAFNIDVESLSFKSSLFEFYKRPNISFMYIAALDDHNVPSEFYCTLAESLFKSANHPNYTILRYPGTGHIIEPPYNPLCSEVYFKDVGVYIWNGGRPVPHCRAQVDIWSKELRFLNENLSDGANPIIGSKL